MQTVQEGMRRVPFAAGEVQRRDTMPRLCRDRNSLYVREAQIAPWWCVGQAKRQLPSSKTKKGVRKSVNCFRRISGTDLEPVETKL